MADDNLSYRHQVLKGLAGSGIIDVIAEANTTDETLQLARQLLPNIVLLDTHMPGLLATNVLLKKLIALKQVKVIMLGTSSKAAEVHDLLSSGACGYLLKKDHCALISMTVLMVHRGANSVTSPSLPRFITRLTAQEREILRHLAHRGQLSKTAERMGISMDALQELLKHLSQRLELSSTEEVVKRARKHGF